MILDSIGLGLKNNDRYKTDLTLLMPTFLLLDSEKYERNEAYKDPKIVTKDFPLGGMTLFLTRHMLQFTGMKDIRAHPGYYKIKEIRNKKISKVAGKFFSLFAINPHYYFQEAWKEYKYYAYILGFGITGSIGAFKWYKSKNGNDVILSKI